ncbi:MAG: MCE family protein [Deltaproteobacteria bacterium]|nr:MCE family protein [Deltaproteobacteria bacterium]
MLKLSPEAKVGIFVLLGVILLVYMSLRVGGIQFGRGEGYEVFVKFDSAAGLDKDASVRVAGVEVGKIKEIVLDEKDRAKVVLRINPRVKLKKDFTAVLKTKGLLGEKYLELVPGAPDAPVLEPGGEITRTTTYTDMDRLITQMGEIAGDIKMVSESVRNVLGGGEGEATLRAIVTNIEELTSSLNNVVAANDERFGRMMANLEEFSRLLRERSPEIAEGLKSVTDNLNQVIAENRSDLKEGITNIKTASSKLEETLGSFKKLAEDVGPKIDNTLSSIKDLAQDVKPKVEESVDTITSIARKIDRGEGTLGKLINEPTVHESLDKTLTSLNTYFGKVERFQTTLSYRGEYLFDAEDTKSYFSLRIQPKADKYYLVEVVDDPRGKRRTKTTETTTGGGTTTTKEVTTSDSIKFTAQVAKRFYDVTLRGGLIESTGGFGVDYYLFKDRLKFTLEAFDFDKQRNPHLKIGATYNLNKYFFITGGYDDFISRVGLESAYLGLGFQFDDEDIKYLLTSGVPIPR